MPWQIRRHGEDRCRGRRQQVRAIGQGLLACESVVTPTFLEEKLQAARRGSRTSRAGRLHPVLQDKVETFSRPVGKLVD